MFKNTSILVAGPVYPYTKKFIEQYQQFGKVIFSTGENDNTDNFPCEVLKNKYPDKAGKGNINKQITTSLAGLSCIDTEHCIRVRSDILLNDLNDWIQFYDAYKKDDRIFVLGLNIYYPFAPRDQVFIGKTETVRSIFEVPLTQENYCENTTDGSMYAELYLGLYFYKKFDEIAKKCFNTPDFIRSNFVKRYWQNLAIDRVCPVSKRLKYEWPKYYPNGYQFELASKKGEFWFEERKIL